MKLPEFIRKAMLRRADDICLSRAPDVVLEHGGKAFLARWWLLPRNRFMNVYLHRFTDSDPGRDLHDHPWASLSLLLRGELHERLVGSRRPHENIHCMVPVTQGCVRFRRATFAHRLDVPPVFGRAPLSIFITGPWLRSWGFHTSDGWVHWKEYCERDGVK